VIQRSPTADISLEPSCDKKLENDAPAHSSEPEGWLALRHHQLTGCQWR